MADWKTVAAVVVVGMLALGKCDDDPVTAAKVGAGAAGVAAGVAAGAAVGSAASGAAKGLGKRAEDRVSGRNRPRPRPASTSTTAVPNGPSRPLPPVTSAPSSPLVEDLDLCMVIDNGPCVVTK